MSQQTVEKSGTLKPSEAQKEATKEAQKETPPVVTHHEIHVGGRVLHYTATTGLMPIRNSETDEIEANIFFVAYTLDNAGPQAAADVLLQWRTRLRVGLAAPGRDRSAAGEDAA